MNVSEVIEKYRPAVTDPDRVAETQAMLAHFGSLFHPDNLSRLTREEFKAFLLIKNNKHWEGIHRQGNMITKDMPKLREALGILLDETRPIKERLEVLFPKNRPSYIKGLGRALATPILAVVYPDKYGVYNSRSEWGLKTLGLYPEFHGESFAQRVVIGQILRYIGWVQEHLATDDQSVKGIIIAGDVDNKLIYALKPLLNVELLTYVISFQLNRVDEAG